MTYRGKLAVAFIAGTRDIEDDEIITQGMVDEVMARLPATLYSELSLNEALIEAYLLGSQDGPHMRTEILQVVNEYIEARS